MLIQERPDYYLCVLPYSTYTERLDVVGIHLVEFSYPKLYGRLAQLVRALRWHRRGQWFEPVTAQFFFTARPRLTRSPLFILVLNKILLRIIWPIEIVSKGWNDPAFHLSFPISKSSSNTESVSSALTGRWKDQAPYPNVKLGITFGFSWPFISRINRVHLLTSKSGGTAWLGKTSLAFLLCGQSFGWYKASGLNITITNTSTIIRPRNPSGNQIWIF